MKQCVLIKRRPRLKKCVVVFCLACKNSRLTSGSFRTRLSRGGLKAARCEETVFVGYVLSSARAAKEI